MNFDIAEIIKSYLVNKSYVDKIAGVVKVHEVSGEKGRSIRYPIAFNTEYEECKKPNTYKALTPDSAKKSIIYFEDEGVRKVSQSGARVLYQSNLKLIGWLNGKKLGRPEASLSPLVVNDIIKSIPSGYINSTPYNSIRINVTGQLPKNANIFSKYTYDEKQTQYLMYPYDYFALTIVTDFSVNLDCIPDFDTNDPLTCLNPTT